MSNEVGLREMTFEEEAVFYEKEAKEVFSKENSNCDCSNESGILRRGMRIIRKAREEIAKKNQIIEDTKKGWISVDTNPPTREKGYDWVLVRVKMVPEDYYGVPQVAELRDGKWYVDKYNEPYEEWCSAKITDWRPLPLS